MLGPKVRLRPRCPQLSVMSEVVQISRVFLKVPLEAFALEQLLSQLPRPRLSDAVLSDRSQGVIHSVAEILNLLHVEDIRLDFFSPLLLLTNDFAKNLFIVLGGLN